MCPLNKYLQSAFYISTLSSMLGTWSMRKECFFFSQDVQPDVEDR